MTVSSCAARGRKGRRKIPQETDLSLKEGVYHGSASFPAAIYEDDIRKMDVLWHWHEELEIGWITEGTVLVETAKGEKALHAGDGFFLNTGVLHAMLSPEDGPSKLRSIVFHQSIVGGMEGSIFDREYVLPLTGSRNLRELMLRADNETHEKILSCVRQAWTAQAQGRPDYPLTMRDCLSRICAMLIAGSGPDEEGTGSGDIVREDRARKMLEYIHRNFAQDIALKDIADAASVSVSEALRSFRQIIGATPVQYLKKYRLSRAAQLLQETDLPVSEICGQCGFQDSSYFAKSFREVYGCTPGESRQEPGVPPGRVRPGDHSVIG